MLSPGLSFVVCWPILLQCVAEERRVQDITTTVQIQATLPSDITTTLNGAVPPAITQSQAAAAAFVLGTPMAAPQQATPPPSGIFQRNKRAVSDKTEQIIEGLVEGYLHKEQLHPREKACLQRDAGLIAGDLVSAGDDAVKAIRGMFKKDKDNMDILTVVTDAGIKVTQIIRVAEDLMKECVEGDVLETLNTTATHLKNMTYVGNRLLANGADVAGALAESVTSYDSKDFIGVGEAVGKAFRKILLSRASTDPKLPEGMAKSEIVSKVMKGVMSGFFVEGTRLKVTDLAEPSVDIDIDLERCINDNRVFFADALKGVWTIIAQMSANKEQFRDLFGMFFKKKERRLENAKMAEGMSELAIALVSVPKVLERCDLNKETQEMVSDAVKSLQWARFSFDPGRKEKYSQKETRELMATAVESWTNFKFSNFGWDIGQLIRAGVLLAFPQKYAVDKAGHLKKILDEVASARTRREPLHLSSLTLVLSCATASMATVFLTARAFQAVQRRRYDSLSRRDISRHDLRQAGSETRQDSLGINADIGWLES